jgi:hypothetical protein
VRYLEAVGREVVAAVAADWDSCWECCLVRAAVVATVVEGDLVVSAVGADLVAEAAGLADSGAVVLAVADRSAATRKREWRWVRKN